MNTVKIYTADAIIWPNGVAPGHTARGVEIIIDKVVFIDWYEGLHNKFVVHISYGYCYYSISYPESSKQISIDSYNKIIEAIKSR